MFDGLYACSGLNLLRLSTSEPGLNFDPAQSLGIALCVIPVGLLALRIVFRRRSA